MSFFSRIGDIYGSVKTVAKEAGITQVKIGDTTVSIDPEQIAVNETKQMTETSPIQIIAKPQVPTKYLIIGGVGLVVVLALFVKAFK